MTDIAQVFTRKLIIGTFLLLHIPIAHADEPPLAATLEHEAVICESCLEIHVIEESGRALVVTRPANDPLKVHARDKAGDLVIDMTPDGISPNATFLSAYPAIHSGRYLKFEGGAPNPFVLDPYAPGADLFPVSAGGLTGLSVPAVGGGTVDFDDICPGEIPQAPIDTFFKYGNISANGLMPVVPYCAFDLSQDWSLLFDVTTQSFTLAIPGYIYAISADGEYVLRSDGTSEFGVTHMVRLSDGVAKRVDQEFMTLFGSGGIVNNSTLGPIVAYVRRFDPISENIYPAPVNRVFAFDSGEKFVFDGEHVIIKAIADGFVVRSTTTGECYLSTTSTLYQALGKYCQGAVQIGSMLGVVYRNTSNPLLSSMSTDASVDITYREYQLYPGTDPSALPLTDLEKTKFLKTRKRCRTQRLKAREANASLRYGKPCYKEAAATVGIRKKTARAYLREVHAIGESSIADVFSRIEVSYLAKRAECVALRAARAANGDIREYSRTCGKWAAAKTSGIGEGDARSLVKTIKSGEWTPYVYKFGL